MNDRFGSGMGVLCKVCGDRASGKHYGVPSCDGCRGFFKRSIRRNLEYVCKEGGKCIVDVSRRNQCQACRFSKCLEANMRREAVQHERAPKIPNAGSTASGIQYHASFYGSRHHDGIFPFQLPTSVGGFPFDNYYMPSPYYPHLTESLNLKLNESIYKPQLMPTYNMEIGKILTNNLFSRMPSGVEPKAISNVDKNAKENEVTSSEETLSIASIASDRLKCNTQSLYDSATKLLFLAIRWAKSIPSFNQLPMNEQKHLLNESWAELFVVAASQWGLSINDDHIKNYPHLKILQSVISHFTSLKVDHFEAACLKALILFRGNPVDASVIVQQVSLLQNQTICLLIEKSGGLRLGHLLLMLPQIRLAGNFQALQESLFKHTIGEIFIEKVLDDAPQI